MAKTKRRSNAALPQRPRKRGGMNGRISKAHRPSNSYRATTRELLKTFPELPTGPSGRRRQLEQNSTGSSVQSYLESPSEHISDAPSTNPDTPVSYMEQDDDYSPYDDDEVFSGNSCGSSVDSIDYEMGGMLRDESRSLLDLPARLWGCILSHFHPVELAQLPKCGRFFNTLLQQDIFWRVSRNNHLPGLPKPALGLSEVEMFRLLFGLRCMVCGGRKDVKTYWPFRARCCKQCLCNSTTKEFLLRSDTSPFPEELLDALPFGIVDVKDNWIPNAIGYQPNIGMTKIYWNKDLYSMRDRYQEAKDMLAADEWLKGLESDRIAHMQDIERIEKFERLKSAELFGSAGPWKHLRASVTANMVSKHQIQGIVQERTIDPRINITKQREIEYRCLSLDDSLTLEAILHFPEYQEAIRGDGSLVEESWELLRAALLKNWPSSGEKKQIEKSGVDRTLPTQRDGSEPCESGPPFSIVSKEELAGSIHASNRAKLAEHAQDVIHKWDGNISSDTIPKFSADVLRYCRQKFITDESTWRKRLTMDDMKYVFDTKIKPLVHLHRMEMFLCNGCPNNPKWWSFESLVQHFTAKHTYNPRGRPAKVNWKVDWPDIGPFRPDPDKAQPEGSLGTSNEARSSPHSAHIPQPFSLQQNFVPTAPRRKNQSSTREEARNGRLDVLAGDARDAWLQLANIKKIPLSVHVHFVVTRTARKYQSRFSESISLSLFLEALSEHPAMSAIRSVKGLGCIQCQRHHNVSAPSKAVRVFKITALLQHFEIVHLQRAKSAVVPDWTRDMVRLPHPRVISALADSDAVDARERRLLEDVFPWAFVKNDWAKNSAGESKARSVESSRIPMGPRRAESIFMGVQSQYPAQRDVTVQHGYPISRDRLGQINFSESQHKQFNSMRAGDPTSSFTNDIKCAPSTRIDSHRSERRGFKLNGKYLLAASDSGGIDPRVSGGLFPVDSHGYLDQRGKYSSQPDRQEDSHRSDNQRKANRPSAADFMDMQVRGMSAIETGHFDEPRYARHSEVGGYPANGSSRHRSRSPISSGRYEGRYHTFNPDGQGEVRRVHRGYPKPQYTYPPPGYYGSAEMGEHYDPYRARRPLDHSYYISPPLQFLPPPVIPHPAPTGYYYEAQPAESGSPAISSRYPLPFPPIADRPLLSHDGHEDYRLHQAQ